MLARTHYRSLAEGLRSLGKLGPYTQDPQPDEPVDPAAVRVWAADQGLEVSTRGRIPSDVLARYRTREL